MTQEERITATAAIKACIVSYLQTKGIAPSDYGSVVLEIKGMWIAIEEAGLKAPGTKFENFAAHCQQAAHFQHMRNLFGV